MIFFRYPISAFVSVDISLNRSLLFCFFGFFVFFLPLLTYVFPHNPLFPPFFFPLTHLSFLYLSQLLSSPTLPPHTSPLFLHSSSFTFMYAIPSLPYFHSHHSPSCLPSVVAHHCRRRLLPVPRVGLKLLFFFLLLSLTQPRPAHTLFSQRLPASSAGHDGSAICRLPSRCWWPRRTPPHPRSPSSQPPRRTTLGPTRESFPSPGVREALRTVSLHDHARFEEPRPLTPSREVRSASLSEPFDGSKSRPFELRYGSPSTTGSKSRLFKSLRLTPNQLFDEPRNLSFHLFISVFILLCKLMMFCINRYNKREVTWKSLQEMFLNYFEVILSVL